jgi:hypothetical protein
MLIIPTTAQREHLKEQLTKSKRLGTFTATLQVEPFEYVTDNGYLNNEDPKRYSINSYIDLPERIHKFDIFIPRNAQEGLVRVSTNPISETTAYAVYFSAVDGGLKLFIGSKGFVTYKYDPSERRIEGEFEYDDVLGKTFKGAFNVNEV